MFRGKESSNRMELSQLVQDLLNFGVLGSLWLLGRGQMGRGHLGAWGCSHTCVHAHACSHMHTHTCIHVYKLQMTAPMEAAMFIMFTTCMCVCVCVCMGHPPTHPTQSTQPPPPPQSKKSITLELIKII